MVDPAPANPDVSAASQPSFQQAMEITAQWLALWEQGELSDEVLADRVAELVASRDGARGFFVLSLAGECPLMDRMPEALVVQLRSAGEGVVDLSARNLAMSTAMALHHARSGDGDQQAGSERVQARCIELLRQLEPEAVKRRLESLLAAAQAGGGDGSDASSGDAGGDLPSGDDGAFLERWGYDEAQKAAIAEAILAVAESA